MVIKTGNIIKLPRYESYQPQETKGDKSESLSESYQREFTANFLNLDWYCKGLIKKFFDLHAQGLETDIIRGQLEPEINNYSKKKEGVKESLNQIFRIIFDAGDKLEVIDKLESQFNKNNNEYQQTVQNLDQNSQGQIKQLIQLVSQGRMYDALDQLNLIKSHNIKVDENLQEVIDEIIRFSPTEQDVLKTIDSMSQASQKKVIDFNKIKEAKQYKKEQVVLINFLNSQKKGSHTELLQRHLDQELLQFTKEEDLSELMQDLLEKIKESPQETIYAKLQKNESKIPELPDEAILNAGEIEDKQKNFTIVNGQELRVGDLIQYTQGQGKNKRPMKTAIKNIKLAKTGDYLQFEEGGWITIKTLEKDPRFKLIKSYKLREIEGEIKGLEDEGAKPLNPADFGGTTHYDHRTLTDLQRYRKDQPLTRKNRVSIKEAEEDLKQISRENENEKVIKKSFFSRMKDGVKK